MTKKILFITVRSDFGGGPRHIHQLVKELSKNFDVYMAYPNEGEPYAKLWNDSPDIKSRIHIPFRKFSISSLLKLRNFVNSNRIQIIHSHGNGAGLYSRLLKILCKDVKVIHTFHGISDTYSNPMKSILNSSMNHVFKFLTDSFVFVSKGEYALGMKRNFSDKDKSVIIYNGIANPDVQKSVPNLFTIITISRFDYQKNMDLCYEIAKILKENKGIGFVWVGDGPDYERLKAKAKEETVNIEFTGFQTKPMEYVAKSSIYLSTSRFEGLPYSLIEAASLGLPIVATNVKGNNEVVQDKINGFLFGDALEGVKAIERLWEDSELYASMGRNSVLFFEKHFTEKQMIRQLEDLYLKI